MAQATITAAAPKMQRRQTLLGDHPIASAATMLEMYEPGDVIGSGSFGIIVGFTNQQTPAPAHRGKT